MKKLFFFLALLLPIGAWASQIPNAIFDNGIESAIPESTIIPWGTEQAWVMKYVYFDELGNEPGTDGAGRAWTDAEFDDSSWKTLTGPIARYDTDFSVVNTIWEKENSCYYLRRTFNLDEVNKQGYYFCSRHDDNIKVWINGTLVVEAGFNGRCQYHHIPASAFVEGTNTMAIYLDDIGGGAYLDYCMANFYFLKNVETGKFLNAGDEWRAALADEGLPVRLHKQADGSYTIYFPYGSQNDQLLYRTGEEGVFVDYSKEWAQTGCPNWTFTYAGDGLIHIQAQTTHPTYGQEAMPGTYVGNNPSSNYVDGNITVGNNITWKIETLPARTETQTARLQELVAAAKGLWLDTSGEEEVLNNSEATYLEMLETIYELQNRIYDEQRAIWWAVPDIEKIPAGTKYELDDITLTIGEAGSNDFAVNEWEEPYDETFKNLICGNGENGNKEGGTFYLFTPKKNGDLKVVVRQNVGGQKKFYVEESGRVMDAFNGILPDTDESTYRGSYTIPVFANLTYKVYCAGSKMGLYGFIFKGRDDAEWTNIEFADEKVKALCVANWDTNKDGELSLAEAAAVTDINGVFNDNKEITSFDELRFFTGLTSLSFGALNECFGLKSVCIPANIVEMDGGAFASCHHLEYIGVDASNPKFKSYGTHNAVIERAANRLVVGCPDAIIPDDITTIGKAAFWGHAGEWKDIPASVTKIDEGAFAYGGLNAVNISDNVEYIGESAFRCNSLWEVVIPAKVTYIGKDAFNECYDLGKVTVLNPNPIELINAETFNNRANATLYVSANSKAAYEAAPIWKEFKRIVETGWAVTSTDEIPAGTVIELEDITMTIGEAGSPNFTVDPWDTYDEPFTKRIEGNGENGDNEGGTFYLFTPKKNGNLTVVVRQNVGGQKKFYVEESGRVMDAFNGILPETTDDVYIGTYTIPVFANLTYKIYCAGSKMGFYGFTFKGRDDAEWTNIEFADEKVKALCVANWDTNNDGELSQSEAAAVTSLGNVFKGNKEITSFDEFRFFTSVEALTDFETFADCLELKSITIPFGVKAIAGSAFANCCNLERISVDPANATYDSRINCNAVIETAADRIVVGCQTTTIPETVTKIGDCSFWGRWGLEEKRLPASVKEIEACAFAWCGMEGLSVILPEGLETIGESAFTHSGLKTITLPKSLKSLGKEAFRECKDMTGVTILDGLTEIPDSCFRECESLTKVSLGKVKTIGSGAFQGTALQEIDLTNVVKVKDGAFMSSAIKELTVPATLTEVDIEAFSWNWSMTKATFEDGCTRVFDTMFHGNRNLDEVILPSTIKSIDPRALARCPNLTTVSLPEGLEEIHEEAFIESGLTNILLPSTVTYIGKDAFKDCKGLTSVTVLNPTPVVLESAETFNNRANATLYVPKGSQDAYKNTAIWKGFKQIIELETIADGLYEGIYYLQNVETGKYLNQGNCWGMRAVLADEGLPVQMSLTDKGYTFYFLEGSQNKRLLFRFQNDVWVDYNEGGLPYWTITETSEKGVYHIQSKIDDSEYGQQAMPDTYMGNDPSKEAYDENNNPLGAYNDIDGGVSADKNIRWRFVPANNTIINFADDKVKELCVAKWDANKDGELSIGEAAAVTSLEEVFNGNTEIQSFNELRYFGTRTVISRAAFEGCTALSEITLPTTITRIKANAFKGCTSLHNFTFPSYLERIDEEAFKGSGITKVELPMTMKWVGNEAFSECQDLEGYVDQAYIEHLGYKAFSGCPKITKTSMPSTVVLDEESWGAFGWNESLNEVEFFAGTTRIDNMAFVDCPNLKSLPYGLPSTLESIGGSAFEGTALESISIPEKVTWIQENAFKGCNALTTVTALNPQPIELENAETFSNRANATLYVPAGSVEAYKEAKYWKEFKEILPIGGTDVTIETTDVTSMADAIYFLPVTAKAGADVVVPIRLKNSQPAAAYQLELVLPEGLSVVKATMTEKMGTAFSLATNDKGNGIYKMSAYNLMGKTVAAGDETVINVTLHVAAATSADTYVALLQKLMYSNAAGEAIRPNNITTTVTVGETEFEKGDANGDGKINVADIVAILNYTLEKPQRDFVFAAADVNNDGDVDVADLVMLANKIFGK